MKKRINTRKQDVSVRLVETCCGSHTRVYNANLARALKNINAAILYQQCCYWTSRTKDTETGWFYKTVEEFKEELAMTRCQQNTAIKILLKHGLIEKKRCYMNKRYFRITPKINEFAKEHRLLENHHPGGRKRTHRCD